MHSVKKRFAFTVLASVIRALLSFMTGMLLARLLGPHDYGNMSFLLGTFIAIRQLLDMGSSQAFFTFMSQKLRSLKFVKIYFIWLSIQFVTTIAFIGLLFPNAWISLIWHGESRGIVLLAFAASFLQNGVWTSVQQILEAQRQTFIAQGIGTIVIIVHLIAVFCLWKIAKIGVYFIFLAIFFEYIIATLIASKYFKFAEFDKNLVQIENTKTIIKKFFNYCRPLIYYSWLSFLYSFIDTWLLQKYGGSVKQGYYAVSSQLSTIALLATTSITNIFYKEIAEAFHSDNKEKVKNIYKKVTRSLYLFASIISCFLIPWSKDLINFLLGNSYINGSTTLAIMFLYPIHQSLGQVGGSVLFASEKVEIQVKIGIIFMLLSIILSYFMLAPNNGLFGGLGLGSEGLALKMVIVQTLQVNIVAYSISKIFNWKHDWKFQFITLIGCLAISWAAYTIIKFTGLINYTPLYVCISVTGILYLIIILIFLNIAPFLTGYNKSEFNLLKSNALKLLHLK